MIVKNGRAISLGGFNRGISLIRPKSHFQNVPPYQGRVLSLDAVPYDVIPNQITFTNAGVSTVDGVYVFTQTGAPISGSMFGTETGFYGPVVNSYNNFVASNFGAEFNPEFPSGVLVGDWGVSGITYFNTGNISFVNRVEVTNADINVDVILNDTYIRVNSGDNIFDSLSENSRRIIKNQNSGWDLQDNDETTRYTNDDINLDPNGWYYNYTNTINLSGFYGYEDGTAYTNEITISGAGTFDDTYRRQFNDQPALESATIDGNGEYYIPFADTTFISQVVISDGELSEMNGTYTRGEIDAGNEGILVKTDNPDFTMYWDVSAQRWWISGPVFYCDAIEDYMDYYAYNPSLYMSANWVTEFGLNGCNKTPPSGSITLSTISNINDKNGLKRIENKGALPLSYGTSMDPFFGWYLYDPMLPDAEFPRYGIHTDGTAPTTLLPYTSVKSFRVSGLANVADNGVYSRYAGLNTPFTKAGSNSIVYETSEDDTLDGPGWKIWSSYQDDYRIATHKLSDSAEITTGGWQRGFVDKIVFSGANNIANGTYIWQNQYANEEENIFPVLTVLGSGGTSEPRGWRISATDDYQTNNLVLQSPPQTTWWNGDNAPVWYLHEEFGNPVGLQTVMTSSDRGLTWASPYTYQFNLAGLPAPHTAYNKTYTFTSAGSLKPEYQGEGYASANRIYYGNNMFYDVTSNTWLLQFDYSYQDQNDDNHYQLISLQKTGPSPVGTWTSTLNGLDSFEEFDQGDGEAIIIGGTIVGSNAIAISPGSGTLPILSISEIEYVSGDGNYSNPTLTSQISGNKISVDGTYTRNEAGSTSFVNGSNTIDFSEATAEWLVNVQGGYEGGAGFRMGTPISENGWDAQNTESFLHIGTALNTTARYYPAGDGIATNSNKIEAYDFTLGEWQSTSGAYNPAPNAVYSHVWLDSISGFVNAGTVYSGNKHVTLVNDPVYSSDYSGVYSFNGVNQYAMTQEVPQSTDGSVSHFTWFKPTGAGVVVDELGQPGLYGGWHDSQLEVMQDGKVNFGIWGDYRTDSTLKIQSAGSIDFDRWYHLGLTYSSGVLSAYKDGEKIADSNCPSRSAPANLYYAICGGDSTNMGEGGFGKGSVGSFQVYNKGLTQTEVGNLYSGEKDRFPTIDDMFFPSLWLDASTGVNRFDYNYISQIVLSGNPSVSGTYNISSSIPTYNSEEERLDDYSLGNISYSDPEDGYRYRIITENLDGDIGYESFDGVNWSTFNSYTSQLIITGFTGDYTNANGTYNLDNQAPTDPVYSNGVYQLYGNELRFLNDDVLLATKNNDGSFTPTNFVNKVTISNAGYTSANGVYTRATENQVTFVDSNNLAKIFTDGNYWTLGGGYASQDLINWIDWEGESIGALPNGVVETTPRLIGDGRISSSVSSPNGSVTGTITTSNVATNLLTSWTDQSNNNRNATLNNNQPLLTTIGGNAFVDFGQSAEMYTGPIWEDIEIVGTILVVAYFTENSSFAISHRDNTYIDEFRLDAAGANPFVVGKYPTVYASSNVNPAYDTKCIIETTFNSSAVSLYLNGTPCGSGSRESIIGGSDCFLFGTQSNIAEIIIYKRVLNTSERQEVESYLANKYATVLQKIAFFGGAYGNGEYIRESLESSIFVESSSGDENIIEAQNPPHFISSMPPQFGTSPVYYSSDNAVTWGPEGTIEDPDLNPAPLAALSYSQSSYIQTIVLGGADPDQTGTYTWDGTTFIDGKPKYMGPLKTGAPENNYIYYNSIDQMYILYGYKTSNEEMINLSSSIDLASNWSISEGASEPTVSSIVYTA